MDEGAGVGVVQSADPEVPNPAEVVLSARVADSEHQKDPVGEQATRDEGQRLRGRAIEPLCVIHEAHQGTILADVGQQAEDGHPDEKAIRRRPRFQSECCRECVMLGRGQATEVVEKRGAQLVEAAEGELHLGFDARGPRNQAVRRAVLDVVKEGGLADAGFASQHKRRAPAAPQLGQQVAEYSAFDCPAQEIVGCRAVAHSPLHGGTLRLHTVPGHGGRATSLKPKEAGASADG
jgi:hypothetical protein